MSSEAHERSLRRLVADFAQISPEDQAAVLAELEDGERWRVKGLLREFVGAPEPAAASRPRLHGLSAWLDARVNGPQLPPPPRRLRFWSRAPAGDQVAPFEMTPHAARALVACAEDLASGALAGPQRAAPRRAPSPLAGLISGASRWRA